MFCRIAPLLGILASLGALWGSPAKEGLSPSQLSGAIRTEALTIPTSGELLAAITRYGKPNWQSLYRKPIPTAYTSRPQIALNLGGLLADTYLAIQAEDSQQVKNMGRDIMALAKTLGLSENVLRRGNSITEFAEANQWSALKEELDATQNEVRLAMETMRDQELITLLTLGAWIRGTEAATTWIAANYSPDLAKLLRQPGILSFLLQKMQALPERVREDNLIRSLLKQSAQIEQLVSFPADHVPTPEQVETLRLAAQDMILEISEKR